MRRISLPRTIWWEDDTVRMIDQTRLPSELSILRIIDHETLCECIKEMRVRGAPAIGAAAAFGLALAAKEYRGASRDGLLTYLGQATRRLRATRPTAVNLSWALNRVLRNVTGTDVDGVRQEIIGEARRIAEEDETVNRRIGEVGSKLLNDGHTVLTHCNAGSLATVYYGTALSPVYHAWEQGRNLSVVVDETRPRLQGVKLTAWELSQVGIPCTVIVDSVAAYYMKRRRVDIVLVGADRIALNGDVANKIGTYSLAIVAKRHGVPFYVAAPTSTIDPEAETGDDIPIEERGANEILFMEGRQIAPRGVGAWNPAFDVTPAELIDGVVSEKGLVNPDQREIERLLRS